jgi:hypothetical protein
MAFDAAYRSSTSSILSYSGVDITGDNSRTVSLEQRTTQQRPDLNFKLPVGVERFPDLSSNPC